MKSIFITVLALCLGMPLAAKNVVTSVQPDTEKVLRNPLNGWVMYAGRTWNENFWTENGYDNILTSEGTRVKVSDYANTMYLRTSWSMFEPEEGKYAWNDPDSRLMKLLNSALKRNMKLAFRIVVDCRDQGQNTPKYVFEAGAQGFPDPNNPKVMSPYPDDPVFQEKYSKFIAAMAKHFNDPDKVDFIDAYSLGKWGESHATIYKDYKKKHEVFDWMTSLYTREFNKIPLIVHYHRMIGDTLSWDSPRKDSKQLIESAIKKGYSLRHDAFGMTGYYEQWEKDFAKEWNFRRPILMEGGWITAAHHRYWRDPSGKYREGHAEDVRRGEYEASAEAHVNTMDLRINDETRSWFGDCFDLVKRFTVEGGYRLYPSEITAPDACRSGETVTVSHTWENMGWGYCPTNIPQWNQKYKVGIALINSKGEVVKTFVDDNTDLSKWIKGSSTGYKTTLNLDVPKGKYKWAIGLIDKTKGNRIGLQMAVPDNQEQGGWLILNTIKIK